MTAMGIPSYFSYIIKNYTNIIRKHKDTERIHHLLMDCNSIIYDTYRELEEKYKKERFDESTVESRLIQMTIDKIVEYIELISPEKCVYISFDGVAPFAKMDQQKIRRYKNQDTSGKSLWNTTAITPGTIFMKNLSNTVNEFFSKQTKSYTIIVSCSDEPGEGEHKLFTFIRQTDRTREVAAVYGLDADLIMLSIFHQKYCKNIYVFREAPTFKTVISGEYEVKELLFMDINGLSNSIFQEMGKYNHMDKQVRVNDYVFMCFLLGNDFLPHFPALNIRTHGIQILTDTYYQTIGRFQNRSIIHPVTNIINWKYFGIFMTELAKNEKQYLLKEYSMRAKWDNRTWPSKTPLDIENLMLNLPVIYRGDEKYICPQESGWESRYYKRLFDMSPTEENIKKVCMNYLEGLEWVYTYYTKECKDWRWKYDTSYPPLLKDLIKYIPTTIAQNVLPFKSANPFKPIDQLIYVLPSSQFSLLPEDVRKSIHKEEKEMGLDTSFKRYGWEVKTKVETIINYGNTPIDMCHK